jgi:XTP/dITP diphosphohydrolase
MRTARRYVLATHNPTKVEEYRFLADWLLPDWEPVALEGPEPVEDGLTLESNALIKARAAAAHTGMIAVADDSGLCVDILGGAPGIFSAYWAGHQKDLTANRDLLLDQLSHISDPHRTARFTSAIAAVAPDGREKVAVAHWYGRLATAPAGNDGFPYDTLFIPDDDHHAPGHTIAQWDTITRHRRSHRARAFRELVPWFALTR